MNIRISLSAFFLLTLTCSALAQGKFFTKEAKVKFSSDTPMEKIEGVNKATSCVLDAATGKMEWKTLIKGFKFEKALMEEHFNENYMESTKYPSATFKGEITNLNDVKLQLDGKYNAKVKGKMTIHGVTKDVETTGTIKVAQGKIEVLSNFAVKCEDYGISIPSVVKDNIAKEIKVSVTGTLAPMK
jgi:polyisoprenoid-binding protein YceI